PFSIWATSFVTLPSRLTHLGSGRLLGRHGGRSFTGRAGKDLDLGHGLWGQVADHVHEVHPHQTLGALHEDGNRTCRLETLVILTNLVQPVDNVVSARDFTAESTAASAAITRGSTASALGTPCIPCRTFGSCRCFADSPFGELLLNGVLELCDNPFDFSE